MGKLRIHIGQRVLRAIIAISFGASALLFSLTSALPVGADAPGAAVSPPGAGSGSTPSAGPAIPGNHQAQDEYFASMRQAPAGTSPGLARADAVQQANSVPTTSVLPPTTTLSARPSAPTGQALGAPSGNWQPLGPAALNSDTVNSQDFSSGLVSGRGTALIVAPHVAGLLYLGTADGGVWKSTDDGASWVPLTDNQQSLAVGALALDAADTSDQTLYVGTGETNYAFLSGFNGEAYFGVGVLKTTDGGATWTLVGTGLPGFGTYSATSVGIGALYANGATVWAGTTKGLYKSTNGGANWTLVAVNGGTPTARVTSIAVDGVNVYVVLSEADTGHAYAGIYKSTGGAFSAISGGLPAATSWGRAQLAMAPSTPLTLYLSIANSADNLFTPNGMFKTIDGGATNWLPTTQPPNYFNGGGGGQGNYDTCLVVDPANANIVYAGGVFIVRSTDGGVTWAYNTTPGYPLAPPLALTIHPDQHALVVKGGALYAANDGGIFKAANPTVGVGAATVWTSLNHGINTTQYYAGDSASNFLATPVISGGAQDNGTSRSTSAATSLWNSILGGDGGFVAIDKTDPNIEFAESQFGAITKTTNAGAGTAITWTDQVLPIPTPNGPCNGTLFIAPFVMDPQNSNHVIFGGGGIVCETTNGGTTWHKSVSGVGAQFFGFYVSSVAIAPSNSATLYAGLPNSHVWVTTDGNRPNCTPCATWADRSTGLPPPSTGFITAIAVDSTDANTAYATVGSFSASGSHHVFKTTNAGVLWQDITGNLPNIPTTAIVTYPSASGPTLVVGTDIGVYISTNNGATWNALVAGLPNVSVLGLFMDKAQTTLFAATHGRGMWRISIPGPVNHFGFAIAGSVPNGSPQPFTLSALDSNGVTVTEYAGTVRFTSSDTQAILPPDYTFIPADHGVHTFSATFNSVGVTTVIATDVPNTSLTSSTSVTVFGPSITSSGHVLTGVVPNNGPTTGGTTVTISGANLQGASVSVGGQACSSVQVNGGGTSLTCVTPPHAAGAVAVTVTTTGPTGGSYTANGAFTYSPPIAPSPTTRAPDSTGSGVVPPPTGR